MDYIDQKQDTRNPSEKLQDFVSAAAHRATDPAAWKSWMQEEIDKFAGIVAGLNEAKEETKAAVVAGYKALTDGSVVNFLAKPNAINEPLFMTVANVFDAVSADPNATNKALETLGNVVIKAGNDYSALPGYQKGEVIGKTMFGMINPEGSTEGAEAAMEIANQVATKVAHVVMDTVKVSLEAAQNAAKRAPEAAQQTKQMLLD